MRYLKLYVSIAVPFIISIIWGIYLSKANNPQLYTVTVRLLVLIYSCLYIMEFRVLWPIFVKYMLSTKVINFIPGKERPRLFFYLTLGLLNLILLYNFQRLHLEYSNTYVYVLFLSFNLVSAGFLSYTWTNSFNNFLVKELDKIFSKNEFKINLNKEQLILLYLRLYDNGFINIIDDDYSTDDKKMFAEMLLSNVPPTQPLFKLEMDHIQTHYFYNKILPYCQNLTLETFTIFFTNKNGYINIKSLNVSVSKNQSGPKKEKDIDDIFKNLLEKG